MSFITELKRRNVFKVAIAYVVASWLLLQLTEVLTELLELDTEVGRIVILLLIIGFIPAVIFAWAFELTPEGIKRDHEVERTESITPRTGRKLDFVIIGMLVFVAGYFFYESRFMDQDEAPATAEAQMAKPAASEQPALVPDEDRSIAVLPFANRSRNEDDEFFVDGMHDDLLTQLAKVDDLKVISRTSVMEYRDTTMKIPEIAAELGVNTILEGGVQRAGDRVRVNAQLIDVSTDEHLWAETFDREMTLENLFDIQSELTRQIVNAVRGELTPEEAQSIALQPTDNLEAWQAFLQARAITNRADYSEEKYREAEPYAEQAVELDPDFAEAWAILAEIYAQGVWIGYADTQEQRQRTQDAIDRAVALNPNSAQVKASQGDIAYRLYYDYEEALRLYKEAQELAPGDARIGLFTAITQRRIGLYEESMESFRRAYELDPANVFIATQMIDTLWGYQQMEDARKLADEWVTRYPESGDIKGYRGLTRLHGQGDIETATQMLALVPPYVGNVYFMLATHVAVFARDWEQLLATLEVSEIERFDFLTFDVDDYLRGVAYHEMGRHEEAEQVFRACVENVGQREITSVVSEAFFNMSVAMCLGYLERHDEAIALGRNSLAIYPTEKDAIFGSILQGRMARVLTLAGEHEEAIDLLERNRAISRPPSQWALAYEPWWDDLRDYSRFQALSASGIREDSAP